MKYPADTLHKKRTEGRGAGSARVCIRVEGIMQRGVRAQAPPAPQVSLMKCI